jgi:hypothetical protein
MKQSIILLTILLAAGQELIAQKSQPDQTGFMIGFSAGVGVLSMTGDVTALNDGADISLPNLKFGYRFKQNMAVMVTIPGVSYEENDSDRSIDGFIPSLQYWVKPGWWISGGFGLGLDAKAIYESDGETYLGTAIQVSSGREIARIGKTTLDLQGTFFSAEVGKGSTERKAISFLAGIGFNF